MRCQKHGNLKQKVRSPLDSRIRPSLKVDHGDAMDVGGYCDLELEKLMPGFLRVWMLNPLSALCRTSPY
jgi:hypothetical protein